MIPIPRPNSTTLCNYNNSVINFISSQTRNGKKAIALIDITLNIIKKGLNFNDLLKLDVQEIEELKPYFDNYRNKIISNMIKPIFDKPNDKWSQNYNKENIFYNSIITFQFFLDIYEKYSKVNGQNLINIKKVKVCPYCNKEEIQNGNSHRTSEFDHFVPKAVDDKYPIFALCYYNLIPSCKNCNHIKNKRDLNIINPYNKSLKNDTFFFTCKIDKSIDDINIKLLTNGKKYENAVDDLNKGLELEPLYTDSDIAKEIVLELQNKANLIIYDNYLDILIQEYKLTRKNRDISFRKFVFHIYEDDNDFFKYPFSKLTKDIANQFNLFDYIN